MKQHDALVAALRGEFAAVYLYALIGGRAYRGGTGAERQSYADAVKTHSVRRDQLVAMLGGAPATVPIPDVAYSPPVDPVDQESRTRCARAIENRLEALYAQIVAATTGPSRAFAMRALAEVSSAAAHLGEEPEAFPGLADKV